MRDCFKIDKQMVVSKLEKMLTPRFGSPLAWVHERFIMALGGFMKTGDQTQDCECFDTMTNHWFRIPALPFPVANTTAIVMNN